MSHIFSIKEFLEPNKKYKILNEFTGINLRLSYSFQIYGQIKNRLNLNYRIGYKQGYQRGVLHTWCHNWYEIDTAEQAKIEQTLNVKLGAGIITMPAGLNLWTGKNFCIQKGFSFKFKAKDNPGTEFKRGSVVVPWGEITKLIIEAL